MSQNNKSTGKIIGRGIAKTVLVLGTAGVIGYSVIKGKLLGRPPSKIRKGLLYATLAGLILYKCQGDKIGEVYNYASAKVSEAYSEFYEIKKNNNKKIEYLMDINSSLIKNNDSILKVNKNIVAENVKITGEKSALESTILNYGAIDNVLIALRTENAKITNEKNSLETKLSNELDKYDAKIKTLENKMSAKTNSTANSEGNTEYEQNKDSKKSGAATESYLRGKELNALIDSKGNYVFYESYSSEHGNWIWTFADANISMDKLCIKYYGKKSMSEKINDYNKIHLYSDDALPEGMPVALLEDGLITKEGVYRGGFPRAIQLDADRYKLEDIIEKYYSDEPENLDVLSAILKYNELYNKNIEEMKMHSRTANSSYYVLIPRFLKSNMISGLSELWVDAHEKYTEY